MTELPERDVVENAMGQSRIELPPASKPHALTASPPEPEQSALTLPNGKFVTTLTLSSRTCRWPVGDPKELDFHYCGRRPESGGNYCDSHERRSRQAPRSRVDHQPRPFARAR